MPQPSRSHGIALAALTLVAAGCQDYNFNPVGHCLIQPGSERVTLSNVSTADVLFVVDDSGSMGGEQQKIAANFQAFVQDLNDTNVARKQVGLQPIDFHLAVTTTSIFYSAPTTAFCRTDCPGVPAGTPVCCTTSGTSAIGPLKDVQACQTAADKCSRPGDTCKTTCNGLGGSLYCCDASNVPARTQPVDCTADEAAAGAACGDVQTHFRSDGCALGNASAGSAYPAGRFVAFQNNPRVLHFDKELYADVRPDGLPACSSGTACNRQGYTATQLENFFAQQVGGAWQGNVIAGTCGSGEEQGLQAGRLALQQALSPDGQLDVVDDKGAAVPAGVKAIWPHPADKSKLVLVFVGDEDDCSSPQDPVKGVILSGGPGADTCVADAGLPDGQRKQFAVSDMVDYFAGLGRPLGAAFIVSTAQDTCQDQSCTPGLCCDTVCTGSASVCSTATCGGQAPGSRMLQAAAQFRAKNADVVVGSICDPSFDKILIRIADIVKPPSGLILPTQPASGDITLLRIADAKGTTRKTCRGPAPSTLSAADAAAANWDWWFTAGREQLSDDQKKPTTASRFVYINHATASCEANAGETYAADYLGQLPAGGCTSKAQCAAVLGGRPDDWSCYAGKLPDGSFVQPTATATGTCLCGANADLNGPY